MSKFTPSAAAIAAAQRQRATFREVGVPLYLPALEMREPPAREFALEELAVDACGITIGDEDDDDFY